MTFSPEQIPVAVIGLSCRLPGAPSPEAFWKLVRSGQHAIAPLSKERLNQSLHFDPRKGQLGKTYTKLGATISYDAVWELQRRVPALADCKEPTFLLLCAVALEAWEHAGLHSPSNGVYANTGVYLGHTRSSGCTSDRTFHHLAPEMTQILSRSTEFRQAVGSSAEARAEAILAAVRSKYAEARQQRTPPNTAHQAAWRVARCLGVDGPTMSFNAACASSMQALVQGVRALQLGAIEMAIVGGATYLHSETLRVFSQAQSVSATGSRPLDAEADGLVVGEGCVLFVLKRLDQALADGNPIQAVLGGMGISSDGKGKSLWAPRAEGQIEAIRRAYRGGPGLSSIGYLEAHATSTQLGDATEINALTDMWSPPQHTSQPGRSEKIPLGSVKANIGHTLETAGAAGLLKMILAMQHGEIPPIASLQTPNTKIDWRSSPFYAPKELTPWAEPADGQPRRGAVNSFGIGGLNVHLVVEEFSHTHQAKQPTVVRPGYQVPPEPIAVIGRGCILPGAGNLAELVDLMQSQRDPKLGQVPAERWSPNLYPTSPQGRHLSAGGYVTDFEYDWRRHRVPPKQVATANPLQFMILDAVEQAFVEAGYGEREFNRQRTGVVVGALFGGDFSYQLQLGLRLPEFQERVREQLAEQGVTPIEIDAVCKSFETSFLEEMPALTDETGSFSSSSLASRITKTFNLMGGAAAVEAGMSSSLAALECCCHQLVAGDAEMMICVGGQRDMSPVKYRDWAESSMLASSSPRSPFDSQSDGCLPGEGSVALLLKRLSDAERDGDPIVGTIMGIGAATVGESQHLARTARTAALRALDHESVRPETVGSVELSGTGRSILDEQVFMGLREVLEGFGRKHPAWLGSIVPQVGHLSGASGLASLLRATVELERREAFPNVGLNTPRTQLARQSSALSAKSQPVSLQAFDSAGRCFAGVHSGSVNDVHYHVVLQRGAPIEMKTPGFQIVHFDATMRRKKRLQFEHSKSAPRNQIARPVPVANENLEPSPEATLGEQELAEFLVNFVVEQTGYPPEMVELDADLEADLGIDSIKKAQLFGELREYFDLQVDEQLSLDDFPTLEHVRDFISGSDEADLSSDVTSASTRSDLPTTLASPAQLNGHAHEIESLPPGNSLLSEDELANFLVNFVVEQTGYPPEMVELDADLEADLGIDSIKKAQLFGELREYFDVEINEQLSLDDFPTLEHVSKFLQHGQVASTLAEGFSGSTRMTTQSDGGTNASSKPVEFLSPILPSSTTALSQAEMADFLVNFVVEQTGYPPEMVELDADLEADLGIDSIKKAQMFGELREYFDVEINEQLSLDEFPDLQHVLQYLAENAKPR